MLQHRIIKITIIAYETVQQSAVYGLADLFLIAEKVCNSKEKIKVNIISKKDFSFTEQYIPDIIILPPSLKDIESNTQLYDQNLIDFLLFCHNKKCIIASVCAGVFILAHTGLLDNKEATTHWIYADILKKYFPKIIIKKDKILIDNGDIITAGGMMAWTDLGLRIIERFLTRNIMLQTAQLMLIDPPRELQSPYIHFSPKFDHGDAAVTKAQHWLLTAGLRQTTIKELINQSGLTERTFLRRFKKATTFTPQLYLQNFRIECAKNILGTTKTSIDQTSWNVGYANTSAFRKIFTKITCMSPREYRKKYGVNNKKILKKHFFAEYANILKSCISSLMIIDLVTEQ